MRMGRATIFLAAIMIAGLAHAAPARMGPDSGLPVPRFETIVVKDAKGRRGPSTEHAVVWEYKLVGLPVEVVAEAEKWRRVRDPAGDLVWIHASNLRSRRSVFVQEPADLLARPGGKGAVVARLGKGVAARLIDCASGWRKVSAAGRTGWIEAGKVWGAPRCTEPADTPGA